MVLHAKLLGFAKLIVRVVISVSRTADVKVRLFFGAKRMRNTLRRNSSYAPRISAETFRVVPRFILRKIVHMTRTAYLAKLME